MALQQEKKKTTTRAFLFALFFLLRFPMKGKEYKMFQRNWKIGALTRSPKYTELLQEGEKSKCALSRFVCAYNRKASHVSVVSVAAVIRVVTQRSYPLTAAHSSSAFLSLKLTNKEQASIFWKLNLCRQM